MVSTTFLHRKCRNGFDFFLGDHDRAFFAAGDGGEFRIAPEFQQRRVEIGGLVQALQFRFVREQQIDRAAFNQFKEFAAIAVDAKCVG